MKKDLTQRLNDFTKEIAKEFESEFIRRLPGIKYEYSNSDNLDFRIPAINKAFGDIQICIWYREITVYIGNRFHTHFDMDFSHEDTSNNDAKQVVSEVIEFIEDILNERILLSVKMCEDRVISSSIVYADNINEAIETMGGLSGLIRSIFFKKSRILLYSWSGHTKEIR